MTSKKKAEELVLSYLRACDNKEGWFNTSLAKKAALIAVDEIIGSTPTLPNDNSDLEKTTAIMYWVEVKNEILKL